VIHKHPYKTFRFWFAALALIIMVPTVQTANAEWIWDYNGTTSPNQPSDTGGTGTWNTALLNWYNGSANVAWDNNNLQLAQFSQAVASTAYTVTVDGAIKANGVKSYKSYTFSPATGGGSIELGGANPVIQAGYTTKFNLPVTTAAGVTGSVNLDCIGTSTRYLYFGGAATFNAPVKIGQTPASSDTNGLLVILSTNSSLAGTGGITVYNGSTLSIRNVITTQQPITIGAVSVDTGGNPVTKTTGYGSRGAISLYSGSEGSDLQGSLTLVGDSSIFTRAGAASDTISGQVSGDYTLSVFPDASNAPGYMTLTNANNSTKRLVLSNGSSSSYPVVNVNAKYAATQDITVGAYGKLVTNAAANLVTPLLDVTANGKVDATAAGLTVSGACVQTLKGKGTVVGNVVAAAGGSIEPGESPGTLTITGNLDMSAGGNLTWELAALKDSSDGTAGTDFDLASVSGSLTLGGTSQLTLNLAAVGNPDAGVAFWTVPHSWKVIDVGAGPTAGSLAVSNGSYAAGTFTTSTADSGADAGDAMLNYVPIPEPSTLILLALAGLALAAYRRRSN
jgi:fibronectin-binding autotransporter adhesin